MPKLRPLNEGKFIHIYKPRDAEPLYNFKKYVYMGHNTPIWTETESDAEKYSWQEGMAMQREAGCGRLKQVE